MTWLDESELRVGLGCMRLSTDPERDEERALATIAAAVEAGVTVFDTARAYDDNERLLARSMRAAGARSPRIVTKGGLTRRDTRAQLDEAVELAPITAVQVGLSVLDDTALRGGLVDRCFELGITVMAHSPLGGPRRAGVLARHRELTAVAERHDASVAETALAWLLGLGPDVIAIAGARRPETARVLDRAASLHLDPAERERLVTPRPGRRASPAEGEVVVIMGIPGAGKSRLAHDYVDRGFARLNRDERGGTLRGIARALDESLASGRRRVVLDNTYLTRAIRSHVVDVAARRGVPVRCIWLNTPLAATPMPPMPRCRLRTSGPRSAARRGSSALSCSSVSYR